MSCSKNSDCSSGGSNYCCGNGQYTLSGTVVKMTNMCGLNSLSAETAFIN